MTEPTREQPAVTPTASPEPGGFRWQMSRIPAHLGRARTSTVVLTVLFLAIGTLYLFIRPASPGTTTTGNTGVEAPAAPRTAVSPTTPETTTAVPTTSAEVPTTTQAPTPTASSTDVTTPGETSTSTVPTPTVTTTQPTLPSATVTSPTG
jgi:hypothetical protein